MTLTRRAVTVAAAVLTFLFVAGGTAIGHAQLVSSDPAEGGSLEHTPYTMTATFTEVLTPDGSSLVVRNSAGAEVASGTVSPDDTTTMTVDLPVLDPGQYVARWTAVTADDLAVERGTITFAVAPQPSCTDNCTGNASSVPTLTVAPATPTPAQTLAQTPLVVPTPTPTLSVSIPELVPGSTGADAVLALLIGAIVIGLVAFYIFRRSRR